MAEGQKRDAHGNDVATGRAEGATTAAFFDELPRRQQAYPLPDLHGTLRFDLRDGEGGVEHWYVTLRKGQARVEQRDDDADCVLTADLATFDEVAAGRLNPVVALLRGLLDLQGEAVLLVALQRAFPGPRDGDEHQAVAGYAVRHQ